MRTAAAAARRAAAATAVAARPTPQPGKPGVILVDQDGAGQPAPPGMPGRCGKCHIVGNEDGLYRDALGAGQLGRESEVQAVPGVVLDDEQGAGGAGGGTDGGQNGVGARRGEDVAGDRGAEHAPADVAGVRRFMTAAAAGDHCDLARGSVGDLGTDQDRLAHQSSQARKDSDQSLDHLLDDGGGMVNQFLPRLTPFPANAGFRGAGFPRDQQHGLVASTPAIERQGEALSESVASAHRSTHLPRSVEFPYEIGFRDVLDHTRVPGFIGPESGPPGPTAPGAMPSSSSSGVRRRGAGAGRGAIAPEARKVVKQLPVEYRRRVRPDNSKTEVM